MGHVLKECTSKSICGMRVVRNITTPSLHNVEISGLSHSISDNRYARRKETHVLLPIMKVVAHTRSYKAPFLFMGWGVQTYP